jgi:hypothetical protein
MAQPDDKAMLDWLATRCYLPGDLPENRDQLFVVVPETVAPLGSFTCDPDNDAAALRAAIRKAMYA